MKNELHIIQQPKIHKNIIDFFFYNAKRFKLKQKPYDNFDALKNKSKRRCMFGQIKR